MPFQSEKQRRFLHANHPEIAKRWEREYATGGISNHFQRRPFEHGDSVSLQPEFLDKNLMEKYNVKGVLNTKVKSTPYKNILETHPAYPALDLDKVRIGTIDDVRDLAGGYHKGKDITSLSSKYTNPDKMTRYDLGKLMHETTHRSMNVDPGVVDVLGVGGSNINYTKGKWEYDPEEFGFTGPVKYPQDTSEIFTRRVDADSWDAKDKISKKGEFQTDIEVADAAKLDKRIHDPILDRRTGVHWRTRGAGAAPGEALRARLGI